MSIDKTFTTMGAMKYLQLQPWVFHRLLREHPLPFETMAIDRRKKLYRQSDLDALRERIAQQSAEIHE